MSLNKKTFLISAFLAFVIFQSMVQTNQGQAVTITVTKTIPYDDYGWLSYDYLEHGVQSSYAKVKLVTGVSSPYAQVTQVHIWWRSRGWPLNYLLDWVKVRVTLQVGSLSSTKEYYVLTTDDWGYWEYTKLGADGEIYPSNFKVSYTGKVYITVETIHLVHVYNPVWGYYESSHYRICTTGLMYCGTVSNWN